MTDKKAFSFIEVLVSIVLLSIGLLALLKFDGFLKFDIEKSMDRHKVMMLSSGFNLEYLEGEKSLESVFKFGTLRDDEKKFLKDTKIEIEKVDEDDFLIYSDSENHYEMNIFTVKYSYEKGDVVFYKVIP